MHGPAAACQPWVQLWLALPGATGSPGPVGQTGADDQEAAPVLSPHRVNPVQRVLFDMHRDWRPVLGAARLPALTGAAHRLLDDFSRAQPSQGDEALLRTYRWDWAALRTELPGLARARLPCDEGDLTGPGIAVDETAQLKDGDATACAAPRHAGCTGHAENCVTTVFSAWVTTSGQAWADYDVFMPQRRDKDRPRRRAARIPGRLRHQTKPQLAAGQLKRLPDAEPRRP